MKASNQQEVGKGLKAAQSPRAFILVHSELTEGRKCSFSKMTSTLYKSLCKLPKNMLNM